MGLVLGSVSCFTTQPSNHHHMKKELFYKICDCLTSTLGKQLTIKEKDTFISYSFLLLDFRERLIEFKKRLAEVKRKVEANEMLHEGMSTNLRLAAGRSVYLVITYDNIKDKISVKHFETGWKYAQKKKRFYPFCRNTPLLCYSKHLYYFMKVIGGGYKPRIIKGDSVWGYDPSLSQIIKMILNIDYTPSLPVSSKYHFNSKDEWEVLEKVSGLKIAKSLKIFNVRDVHQLISVMKDTNELQTLYKYLANPIAASVKIDSPESFFIQMTH